MDITNYFFLLESVNTHVQTNLISRMLIISLMACEVIQQIVLFHLFYGKCQA